MKKYYVNNKAQDNGDHEVHSEDCLWLSLAISSKYLGQYNSCSSAVREAKKTYPRANGCKTCSKECHTT